MSSGERSDLFTRPLIIHQDRRRRGRVSFYVRSDRSLLLLRRPSQRHYCISLLHNLGRKGCEFWAMETFALERHCGSFCWHCPFCLPFVTTMTYNPLPLSFDPCCFFSFCLGSYWASVFVVEVVIIVNSHQLIRFVLLPFISQFCKR